MWIVYVGDDGEFDSRVLFWSILIGPDSPYVAGVFDPVQR